MSIDPSCCPLCGQPNECQLCTVSIYKGPCWCAHEEMPAALLARVPETLRNRACICRACVEQYRRDNNVARPFNLRPVHRHQAP